MYSLSSPWFLLALLIPIAFRLFALFRKRQRPAIAYSSLVNARLAGKSWRIRLRRLPEATMDIAFVLLTIALARPQESFTTSQAENASEGIAIEMVLDRSASMCQEMSFGNRRTTRLDAVKEVFSLFVFGDEDKKLFKGRDGDLVGLVTFAKTAETNCPLTLGHDALTQALDAILLIYPHETAKLQNAFNEGLDLNSILLPTSQQELYAAFARLYGKENARQALQYYIDLSENNQTAIGDALALGLARLKQYDVDKKDYKIKSKVLILLTDGENNYGRDVSSVISYAKDCGIKVHVIAIGEARSLRGNNDLPKLAKETGGIYMQADSADELVTVYQSIDTMERSKLTDTTFTNTRELFQPFLLGALALLALYAILKTTVFRTLP